MVDGETLWLNIVRRRGAGYRVVSNKHLDAPGTLKTEPEQLCAAHSFGR
jgi:hypothetical protein